MSVIVIEPGGRGRAPRADDELRMLTVADAAETAQVSTRTVWTWISEGALPVVRLGRCVRIRRADLEAFIDRATTPLAA